MSDDLIFAEKEKVMDLFNEVFDAGCPQDKSFHPEYEWVIDSVCGILAPFSPDDSPILDPESSISMSVDYYPDRKLGIVVQQDAVSNEALQLLSKFVGQMNPPWVFCINIVTEKFNHGYICVTKNQGVIGWGLEKDVRKLMTSIGFR